MADILKTDIVVVGGGLAGFVAAKVASEAGASVILVDKAKAGTSGPTAFAAGDILCWLPEEDPLDDWIKAYMDAGMGLNQLTWLENMLQENYLFVRRLAAEGYPFEMEKDGAFVRRSGRGPLTKCVLAPMLNFLDKCRQECRASGVGFIDRLGVQKVLLDAEGHACGVMGFDVRTGKAVTIAANVVILASGGCSYRGPFFGQDAVAGESLRMAVEAGAQLAYMEYGNHYNVSMASFDTYGQSKFMAHGGKYVNGRGETFVEKQRENALGHRANGNLTVKAMVEEVAKGNGPIFMDLTEFHDWALVSRLMPNLMLMMGSSDQQLDSQKVEMIPGFTGTSNASAAGILIDCSGQSSVPGLYAAGDAAAKGLAVGACVGITGVSLAWAMYTGLLAGEHAGKHVSKHTPVSFAQSYLSKQEALLKSPLHRRCEVNSRTIIWELGDIMATIGVSLFRDDTTLRAALQRIGRLAEKLDTEVGAADAHELMLWYEAKSSLVTAEATIKSACIRTETRGGHYRTDYPKIDAAMEKVILTRMEDDGRLDSRFMSLGGELA